MNNGTLSVSPVLYLTHDPLLRPLLLRMSEQQSINQYTQVSCERIINSAQYFILFNPQCITILYSLKLVLDDGMSHVDIEKHREEKDKYITVYKWKCNNKINLMNSYRLIE